MRPQDLIAKLKVLNPEGNFGLAENVVIMRDNQVLYVQSVKIFDVDGWCEQHKHFDIYIYSISGNLFRYAIKKKDEV